MALGEFRLFQFKSRDQREKEEREYAVWAFPYGEIQRENLTALIQELNPKAFMQLYLTSFLTCKELYERTLENTESRENAIDKMLNEIRSYNQLIKMKEMPMFLALVLADEEIDESCEYPSADEIRASIQELESKRKVSNKNWFWKGQ